MSEFTIDDLCAATGATRRTIRYYLQRGLIPPPEGGGRRRIYRNEHMLRLKAIRALQERSYPLEEIRHRLAPLGVDDLRELLAALGREGGLGEEATPSPGTDSHRMALPLPPPAMDHRVAIPIGGGVQLVAPRPETDAEAARLLEAARRAAGALRGRPVEWLSHPDPTVEAHLARIREKETTRERDEN